MNYRLSYEKNYVHKRKAFCGYVVCGTRDLGHCYSIYFLGEFENE